MKSKTHYIAILNISNFYIGLVYHPYSILIFTGLTLLLSGLEHGIAGSSQATYIIITIANILSI
jgi:hypothetical protein